MCGMAEADEQSGLPLDYAGPASNPPRRRWVAWLLLGIVVAVLAVLTILPTMGRAREPAKRVMCASNLRQIGQAILLYCNDHQGQYPDSFATTLLDEGLTAEVFVCPDSNDTPATGAAQAVAGKSIGAGALFMHLCWQRIELGDGGGEYGGGV